MTVPGAAHYLAEGIWHHNTGKTYAILSLIHVIASENPGLRILFMRATRVSLTESVLVTYEQEILPRDGMERIADGAKRGNRHSYRYPNGTEIVLAGLDRNATKILSTAWDIVFANECVEIQQEAWETIASRMGRPGRDPRFGWLIGDTNPSHPEHWMKKRIDAGAIPSWTTTHEANPLLRDRSGWTAAGRYYLSQLDQLTGPRRKRLRDGEWSIGEGVWFDAFDPQVHESVDADYVHGLPTYCAIDSGVWTGAVWFQVREHPRVQVNVFDDYLAENLTAERNAGAIREKTRAGGYHVRRYYTDPAGGSRNPVGPTVIAEYERAGLAPLDRWPTRAVSDGLELIQSLLGGDGNPPALKVHPRCKHTRDAFAGYRRAKRANQLMDWPEDPQHPAEEMIDSLRGGLTAVFPQGRAPRPRFVYRPARGYL
jgi:hypothetical protein